MGPIAPIALAVQGGSQIAGGLMARSKAKAEQRDAKINSYISHTRAIQQDVTDRRQASSELSALRAAMGANSDAPTVSTLEMLREFRENSDRERRINVGNRKQEAFDFDRSARNHGAAATRGLLGGLIKAGPSIFDLYDYNRQQGA